VSILRIIHQDDTFVVIDKPPGLLVHRTALDSRATRFAMQMLRDQLQRLVYPVHRLDRGTSGLLVFAFNSDTARLLTEQFAQRRVHKTYIAFVRGHCTAVGQFDTRLRDPFNARNDCKNRGTERSAITDFRTLIQYELPFPDRHHPTSRYSLVELQPRTGRRHQIRRHLKHAAHPIIGDTTHGDHRQNKGFVTRFALDRMLLSATKLSLYHPDTDQPLALETTLGYTFADLLNQLRSFTVQSPETRQCDAGRLWSRG